MGYAANIESKEDDEIIFRNRLLYVHVALLLAGVVGVLVFKQLGTNQQTVQEYQHLESTALSTLDSMLAAYPMYEEIIFRNRLLYAHIALLLAGVVGVLVFMVIHSRTKPNTSPTNVNKAVQKIQKNATNELNKTKNIVQKQTKEYGKQALGIADKAVVQGKKQTGKVYNQALNFMFGDAK